MYPLHAVKQFPVTVQMFFRSSDTVSEIISTVCPWIEGLVHNKCKDVLSTKGPVWSGAKRSTLFGFRFGNKPPASIQKCTHFSLIIRRVIVNEVRLKWFHSNKYRDQTVRPCILWISNIRTTSPISTALLITMPYKKQCTLSLTMRITSAWTVITQI